MGGWRGEGGEGGGGEVREMGESRVGRGWGEWRGRRWEDGG